MKLNKGTMWGLIIVGILVAVAIILIFGKGKSLSIFNVSNELVSVELQSSNAYSNTYKISASSNDYSTGGVCTGTGSFYISVSNNEYFNPVSGGIGTSFTNFNTQPITNTCPFPASVGCVSYNNFPFTDLAQVSSNITLGTFAQYPSKSVPIANGKCSISIGAPNSFTPTGDYIPGYGFVSYAPAIITCAGTTQFAYCPSSLVSGTFSVTMPKKGYCLDNSQCSGGAVCDSISHTCQIQTMSYYELSNNTCSLVQKLSTQMGANDFADLTTCQSHIIPAPTNGDTPAWKSIINAISQTLTNAWNWLKTHFSLAITGTQGVQPGQVQFYNISISAPIPPHSDINQATLTGKYEFQKANWVLLDSNNNTIDQGTWILVNNGIYNQNIQLTIPQNPGNYLLVATIYQYNKTYDPSSKNWMVSGSGVVASEVYGLQSTAPIPTTSEVPAWKSIINAISQALTNAWNWLKNLFS